MARSPAPHATRQKSLGAFYTSESLADAVVRWGVRRPRRAVLDPSCGDGRFLAPAARAGIGRVVGCDVDSEALVQSRRRLASQGSDATLLQADFFTLNPADHQAFDLVVGNPPFIRYQRFTGESRRRALESALRVGVRLTGLTSSWAPFLLHAMQFVAPGGDLAMVVPAEILQTQYGLPTLRAMTEQFESVSLLVSESNYFDEALVETAILLARSRGGHCEGVRLVSARDLEGVLGHIEGNAGSADPSAGVMISALPRARFAEALLLPAQREAWSLACSGTGVVELSDLGTLTNGYVSGDNEFFHRTLADASRRGLPPTWLRPTVRSSKSLRGLAFKASDLTALEASDIAHHLVVPQDDLFSRGGKALKAWLHEGEARGTPSRYKCRVREPWWQVPGLVEADVLVAYMNGASPRAAFNEARAVYTNSLHGLRLRKGLRGDVVAFAMHSSLTLLSLEIEGRSYGGGILKLEPTEMRHARIVLPTTMSASVRKAMAEADELLRSGHYELAVGVADRTLLAGEIGLAVEQIERLSEARHLLRMRRMGRSKGKAR
ncbi:MAG: class I SAM-dependent methyltransferase [Deltaproteobacteria bacterium]|nr:class I SAM-dependent methyltransferase [Deltaproteobacteria bacterium]